MDTADEYQLRASSDRISGMWQCSACEETVADHLEVCPYCGAAADGTIGVELPEQLVGNNADDATPGNDDATPGNDDATPGNDDATPGNDDATPGNDDATPGNDDATPGDTDAGEAASSRSVHAPGKSNSISLVNRRELAALICRTIALVLFALATVLSLGAVFALNAMVFTGLLGYAPFESDLSLFLFAGIPVLAIAAVGLFYWKKAEWIASRMVSDDTRPIGFQPFTLRDAMIVAFSTAGLFFFFGGVRDLVGFILLIQDYSITPEEAVQSAPFWSAIVQLAMSLSLILGSNGIVGAIRWCRTAGHPDTRDDEKHSAKTLPARDLGDAEGTMRLREP